LHLTSHEVERLIESDQGQQERGAGPLLVAPDADFEQSRRKVQRPRPGQLQPADPTLAARPRQYSGAHLLPTRSGQVGEDEFIFVDGGVTMYTNPVFQLFLMAIVEAYNLGWPAGEKEMLLVSIGTGTDLSADGLHRLDVGHLKPEHVQQMDSVDHIPDMQEVGVAVAKVLVI
jgi:hypothetical protein